MGGRLKYCITGAAPISLDVISFMRGALGVPFTEGIEALLQIIIAYLRSSYDKPPKIFRDMIYYLIRDNQPI